VFIKINAKKGLNFHYIDRFKVLERYDKCFKLQLDRKIDRSKSAYIPTNNQRKNETLIDFNQNNENNPHGNNEENYNDVSENQDNIQSNNVTEKINKNNKQSVKFANNPKNLRDS